MPKGVALSFVAKGTSAAGVIQVEKRKQTIPLKNRQKNAIDVSLKKTYRWPTDI